MKAVYLKTLEAVPALGRCSGAAFPSLRVAGGSWETGDIWAEGRKGGSAVVCVVGPA